MTESIFFKSAEHKKRFITTIQQIGKCERDGKLDPEYAAALYILTADMGTWQKAFGYVSRDGIDIEAMLEEVDFSGGYSALIRLAGNLFNDNIQLHVVDIPTKLDESNFKVALTALKLRRYSSHVDDFKA